MIEGHTDSIGDDASNQTFSQQRAASVKVALSAKLGDGIRYTTVGFGEKRPVAPNTNPDGSDNPNGRAQNRRVELSIDTTTGGGAPPPAQDPANTALDGSPLVPTVTSVTSLGGLTLAQVAIHNTATDDRDLGFQNDPSRTGVNGIRADTGGELSLTSAAGGDLRACLFTPSWWGTMANGTPVDKMPAASNIIQWALFAPLPADHNSVTVNVGGYTTPFPARITAH